MSQISLRRISIIGVLLAILLAADGLVMIFTNYKPGDTSSNFLHMSDGWTVVLAAVLVLVFTSIAFFLSRAALPGSTEAADAPSTPKASAEHAES